MKNVHYSVPDSLVGEKVHVKVYSEKIVILYGKEKVASHQRSYCGGDWCIKLEHYLRTLSRKPGALPHSVVWQRAPEELRRLYDRGREPRPFGAAWRGFKTLYQDELLASWTACRCFKTARPCSVPSSKPKERSLHALDYPEGQVLLCVWHQGCGFYLKDSSCRQGTDWRAVF